MPSVEQAARQTQGISTFMSVHVILCNLVVQGGVGNHVMLWDVQG